MAISLLGNLFTRKDSSVNEKDKSNEKGEKQMSNTDNQCTKKAADLVKDYLTRNDWHFSSNDTDGQSIIDGGIGGIGGTVVNSVKFRLIIDKDDMQNYVVCPVTFDEDKRNSVMEFITRANYGLKYGEFQMDLRDGELLFHMTLPTCLASDDGMCEKLIHIPPSMFKKYIKGIERVAYFGVTDIKGEVDKCERENNS